MKQRIIAIDNGSIGDELGITPGCFLLSVNGEPVEDVIDYEQLTACEQLTLEFEDPHGGLITADVTKEEYEPLGLYFGSGLMSPVRACKNKCVFCFIDQMARGVRDTLHFKDDDWRLSLIMGNYVTLTNVDDREFQRILKRKVSPLYVSVHATDGAVRKTMMRNPSADRIMDRLTGLKEAGLRFHSQIVVCPGLNDGDVLEQTIRDLYALRPAAVTVAVVPVGLTKYREGLYPLRTLTKEEARGVINQMERFEASIHCKGDDGFVSCADELYLLAERELPSYETYGDFPQIENGVGLLRKFEREFCDELAGQKPLKKNVSLAGATGVSAYGFLQKLFDRLKPYGIELELMPIKNDYLGETVTVSGLVTAGDMAAQLRTRLRGRTLLIPDDMLRERDDAFLDGYDLNWLKGELSVPIWPLPAADGAEFITCLFHRLNGA